MDVKIIALSEKSFEENDYCDLIKIEVNGKKVFEVHDGEPEDNNLSRNFNDCNKVEDLIKMVHESGLKGEQLNIENIEIDKIYAGLSYRL